MFTLQNLKTKLVYIGFGSFFGCLCTIIGMLLSPVTAQRDKFGEIECTSLTVKGPNRDNPNLKLTDHSVELYASDGKIAARLDTVGQVTDFRLYSPMNVERESAVIQMMAAHLGQLVVWGSREHNQNYSMLQGALYLYTYTDDDGHIRKLALNGE